MKKFPLDPLLHLMGERGIHGMSVVAGALGVDTRDLYRWQRNGVTEERADRLAVAAGTLPVLLWPAWAEDEDARLRALHAAAKRRWRARHPGVRERERVRNRRWKAKNRAAMRRYDAWYDRNRRGA